MIGKHYYTVSNPYWPQQRTWLYYRVTDKKLAIKLARTYGLKSIGFYFGHCSNSGYMDLDGNVTGYTCG